MAVHKFEVSVQDRYLIVDSSYPWTLHFNDNKLLNYQHGRYMADLYASVGSEGVGKQQIRNVWLSYDDENKKGHFDWQTSEIPVDQLTGVDGQQVVIVNWPAIQPVEIMNADVLAVRLYEAGQDIDRTILKAVYPIGAIYISMVAADPVTLFGFGVWRPIAGRFLVGVDLSDSAFNLAGKAGGEKAVSLSIETMPRHTHIQNSHSHRASFGFSGAGPGESWMRQDYHGGGYMDGATAVNQETGGGRAHNNLPPYIAVYMWWRES